MKPDIPVLTDIASDTALVSFHAGKEGYYRELQERVKQKIEKHRRQKEEALERLKSPPRRPPNVTKILQDLGRAAKNLLAPLR